MVAVAKGKGEGWVDYNWPYPGTDEVKPKTSYVVDELRRRTCGVGAYSSASSSVGALPLPEKIPLP